MSRVYRAGQLAAEDVAIDQLLDELEDDKSVIWLDLCQPDPDDLMRWAQRLGVHPLAVEDACSSGERSKVEAYGRQLVLTCYAVSFDPGTAALTTTELTALAGEGWLLTVRKSDDFPLEQVLRRWDTHPELAGHGAGYLLWGLLDAVVDGHHGALSALEDGVERLEEDLFDEEPTSRRVQRRSFALRKSLVASRRVTTPLRDILSTLLATNPGPPTVVDDVLRPYYQDVRDHTIRSVEWTESLRSVVGSIIDTDSTLHAEWLNDVTKKLAAWAAILVLPTLVTGFYGMNTALYPRQGTVVGFWLAVGLIAVGCTTLFLVFRWRHWL